MSLWNLLVGICFFIAVIGSAHSAGLAKVGFGARSVAVIFGVVVGACCAFAMSRTGEFVGHRVSRMSSESGRRWGFLLLYSSSVLWILSSAVLGKWIGSVLLLRLLGRTG